MIVPFKRGRYHLLMRMRKVDVLRFASVIVLIVLAACTGPAGGSRASKSASPIITQKVPLTSLTGPQVLAKALDGMKQAPSFLLSENFGSTSVRLRYTKNHGCAASGYYKLPGRFSIVVIGNNVWTGGNREFWDEMVGQPLPGSVKLLAGKYLKTSAGARLAASFADNICNINYLTKAWFPPPRDLAVGAIASWRGQQALTLTDKSRGGTIYVAAKETPKILAVLNTSTSDKGELTVAYGVPVTVTAPPASSTFDCAKHGCNY